MANPASLLTSYLDLFNRVGWHLYGLRPSDNSTIATATTPQSQDILNCIRDGLNFVYKAWRWSFLRTIQNLTTYAPYSTGTITIVGSTGVVTLAGGIFPSNAASAGGQIEITAGSATGIWTVSARTDDTHVTLSNYGSGDVTAATAYQLVFNRYSLPTGPNGFYYDTIEEQMTESSPSGTYSRRAPDKWDELNIRHRLQWDYIPRTPEAFALTTDNYSPTSTGLATPRYVTFWPIPEAIHVFQFKATLVPTMLDATNNMPLGDAVLMPAIMESCLASAERLIEGKIANIQIDSASGQVSIGQGTSAEAVHNAMLVPLLQTAINEDKAKASPDTLGFDRGGQHGQGCHDHYRGGAIQFIAPFAQVPADQWIT